MNTNPPFQLNNAGIITCNVRGDITSSTESTLRGAIDDTIGKAAADWKTLRIDIRDTRMIDSKGLNLIVTYIKKLSAAGRDVQIVAPQPTVRRVLAFTRIDRHATVLNADGTPA